jgi:lysozyme
MAQKPLVIDLSHYQVISSDLHGAAAQGVAGVIHKVTEGTTRVDPKVEARYSLAKDAGLLWGVYHFLRPGSIESQVDWFLSQKQVIDQDTLLVLDYEIEMVLLSDVLLFLQLVEKKSGQKPVLYSGSYLKDKINRGSKPGELTEYRLWIPQYSTRVVLPKGWDDWWLWQYTDKGKIDGINGPVDCNAYQGDARALRADWVINTNPPVVTFPDPPPPVNPLPDIPPPVEDPGNKPPPDPQVVYKEKASTWSKFCSAVAGFFSLVWSIITGWYASEFARPLIDRARDEAVKGLTIELLPQIGLLVLAVAVIGGVALFFLWLGFRIYDREKGRVAQINETKLRLAASPKLATVDLTNKPERSTAIRQVMGENS